MNKEAFPLGGLVAVAAFLGFAAPLVSFVAASAFETPGTTSTLEASAACVVPALYLAFCQFWVAPRGRGGFGAKLLTVVVLMAPSLATRSAPAQRIPWLASVCLGTVAGALSAHWLTARPQREAPTAGSIGRAKSCRRYLLVGFILLSAVALMILLGVVPSVFADTKGGFSGSEGVFLAVTVGFDLLAAALLAFAVWRSREPEHSSKGILGTTAFLALLLGLIYCGMGVLVSGHGPALRIASVLLILCALLGLVTTALMIVTSVVVDRGRLCEQPVPQLTS
jgi:hypothetical protein